MRKTLVVANWKMHMNASQASILLHRLQERIPIHRDVEVVIAPTMLVLQPLSMQIDRRKFRLAAQNAYQEDQGAFTGEISFNMLRDLVHYVIVGHSERRYKFGETDREIALKVAAALRNNIYPIFCLGETNSERLAGETKQVIHDQIMTGLHNASRSDMKHIVIAYEPIWAIGTGNFAKPSQVQSVVEQIRKNVEAMHGKKASKDVRVLYGGSVTPDVARSYLEIDGVDGLLVGGASLNYHQFSDIVDAAYRYSRD